MNEFALAATALNVIIDDEQRWQNDRLKTIQRARNLTQLGLPVADVCAALAISPATWFRRCRELDDAISTEGEAKHRAAADQAYAGVIDAALGIVGKTRAEIEGTA